MPGSIKYQFYLPQIVKSLIIDKCRTLSNVNILEKTIKLQYLERDENIIFFHNRSEVFFFHKIYL
jgi:hypothetical protein